MELESQPQSASEPWPAPAPEPQAAPVLRPTSKGGARARRTRTIAAGAGVAAVLATIGGMAGHAVATASAPSSDPRDVDASASRGESDDGYYDDTLYRDDDAYGYGYDDRSAGSSPWGPSGPASPGSGSSSTPDSSSRAS